MSLSATPIIASISIVTSVAKHISENNFFFFPLQVPQVKGKILWYECGTPISDSNFLLSYKGGSYGTRCNLQFSSRESSRWVMRPDTEIENLYLAGQDAWTPAVAGAMYGGLLGAFKVSLNMLQYCFLIFYQICLAACC